MKFVFLCILLFIIFSTSMASATHYIFGVVNDARDGTLANGHTVVLWNSANGIEDNLTDTIGPSGNSGADNLYRIDCEMLQTACQLGDELRAKVINNGDNYLTDFVNLSVTGEGYDLMENLILNSPPSSTLNYPQNHQNFSSIIDFNCSASDLDGNLANATLYGNWSGGWHANETKAVSGNSSSVVFAKNLPEGIYKWNCLAEDNLSISDFNEENFTFTIDNTAPDIASVYVNESYTCGDIPVRVNCTAEDGLLGIGSVIIEAIKPSASENFSAQLLTGNTYYADISINEIGEWKFNCIANDSAGNTANLTSSPFNAYSTLSDLVVYPFEIIFSKSSPIENEVVIINATIHNLGCSNADNFLVGFYEGDPDTGGVQINGNKTISTATRSNATVDITWNTKIGTTNIFILVDINNSITEANESNNKANKTFNVGAWQEFYGNSSVNKILSDAAFYNLGLWLNETSLQGNIFIADKENNVDWLSLQAIGVNITNGSTNNDFSDIDILLGMADFEDSVFNTFTDDGIPKDTKSFIVHGKTIENVPVINSTNNQNFVTGILWDASDTSGDAEYSQEDREDLVFITQLNKGKQGAYGNYDYEIKIPVKLRDYNTTDSAEVYFYYEIA